MFLEIFLMTTYFLVAAMAATLTYIEQQESGGRSIAVRSAGFLACAFWPITFVTVLLMMRFRTKA